MKKSLLQKARAQYQPKLPKGLKGAVSVKEGAPTQSVGDQEEIKKLFPNTYGMPLIEFVPGEESANRKMNVGVILSGGQAPGGHNVICGIFETLRTRSMASSWVLAVLLTISISSSLQSSLTITATPVAST